MAYVKQTWVDGAGGGTPINAARLNYMESGIESADGLPTLSRVRLGIASDVAIANQTLQTINWNDEFEDPDNYHNNTTNPHRITVPPGLGGTYLMTWRVDRDSPTAALVIYKNGTAIYDAGTEGAIALGLSAGNYIHMEIWSSAAGTMRRAGGSGGMATHLEVFRIGA